MPKDRYRRYHVEKAEGGIALTMTAGSAIVSQDSPPAFGNLLAYKDEIMPWMKKLTDECHEYGTAVMIQLTHLGRRTNWNKADWLPVLSASPVREPAHRAFPKEMEDWDIDRIAKDYADAAERMEAAGLDGIEFECYGHLIDSFWSPATKQARRRQWLTRQPPALHIADPASDAQSRRPGLPCRLPPGRRRGLGQGPDEGRRHRNLPAPQEFRTDRLPQHHQGPHRARCAAGRCHPRLRA